MNRRRLGLKASSPDVGSSHLRLLSWHFGHRSSRVLDASSAAAYKTSYHWPRPVTAYPASHPADTHPSSRARPDRGGRMALSTTEPEVTPKPAVSSRRPTWPSVRTRAHPHRSGADAHRGRRSRELLSPVFFTTRNLGNVLAPDRGHRRPRDGPAAGHRHPRHRPVGRLDHRAGRGGRRARSSRPCRPAPLVVLAMLGTGLAVGAGQRRGPASGAGCRTRSSSRWPR